MDDEAEFAGRTVDDAIARAEAALGARRDDITITVITNGSRGVFGIGAEPARIRAQRKQLEPVARVQEEEAVPTIQHQQRESIPAELVEPTNGLAALEDTQELPERNGDLAAEAGEVLQHLLDMMGFSTSVEIRDDSNPITLAINGENLGVLIGRRGDNLAALQFMVNLILSKNRRQWPRVIIDVENYRARREESLRTLADRIAFRVRRSGRPFTLEAMPAGDRRIIHLTLRDRSDVETYSIGEGQSRRVVIAPKSAGRTSSGQYSR